MTKTFKIDKKINDVTVLSLSLQHIEARKIAYTLWCTETQAWAFSTERIQ